jgi:hypothetical protein
MGGNHASGCGITCNIEALTNPRSPHGDEEEKEWEEEGGEKEVCEEARSGSFAHRASAAVTASSGAACPARAALSPNTQP